jgi:hypothetical protein
MLKRRVGDSQDTRLVRMEAKRKALEAIVRKPEPVPQVPEPANTPTKARPIQ